jgi:glycerol-3-phosphate O-acyltransferase / dihydroxyacetone phosphate acyltransferase
LLDNYEHAKRFIAAWRVLIGIWAPKHWELSLAALSQYTTPWVPKENPWIDKGKEKEKTHDENENEKNQETKTHAHPMIVPSTVTPSVVHHTEVEPPATTTGTNGTTTRPTMKRTRTQRPSTRRIMRHVLRARVEAVNALAGFFDQLEKEGKVKVRASIHLARLYGEGGEGEEYGWRYASEVVDFLKKRGAKIPEIKLEQGRRHRNGGIGEEEDHDWALSTDAEVD